MIKHRQIQLLKKQVSQKACFIIIFGTKKDLFETLSIYSMTLIGDQIETSVDWDNGDITKRLEEITMIKLTIFKKYPNLLEFSKKYFQTKL